MVELLGNCSKKLEKKILQETIDDTTCQKFVVMFTWITFGVRFKVCFSLHRIWRTSSFCVG